jgi:ABC-type sugar transport system ATPase subunit
MLLGSDHGQNLVTSRAEPLLTLRGVTKRFGSLVALSDASLDIMPGEIHCILGENGAGKSTLCNVIFGVQMPDDGSMSYLASRWCTSISAWCTT